MFVSRERHRQILVNVNKCLVKSLSVEQIDIRAEEIRTAMKNLSKITGNNNVDEILDIIFNDFCIGK